MPSRRTSASRRRFKLATRLTVSLEANQYDEILRLAEKKRVSSSWIVRDAVDQYLKTVRK
jgi:predicted transcriptional regulator